MRRILSALMIKSLLALVFAFSTSLPADARFITPDTWEPINADVGTNRYAYSGNDPINYSDPSGHIRGNSACDGCSPANNGDGFSYGLDANQNEIGFYDSRNDQDLTTPDVPGTHSIGVHAPAYGVTFSRRSNVHSTTFDQNSQYSRQETNAAINAGRTLGQRSGMVAIGLAPVYGPATVGLTARGLLSLTSRQPATQQSRNIDSRFSLTSKQKDDLQRAINERFHGQKTPDKPLPGHTQQPSKSRFDPQPRSTMETISDALGALFGFGS